VRWPWVSRKRHEAAVSRLHRQANHLRDTLDGAVAELRRAQLHIEDQSWLRGAHEPLVEVAEPSGLPDCIQVRVSIPAMESLLMYDRRALHDSRVKAIDVMMTSFRYHWDEATEGVMATVRAALTDAIGGAS